MNSCGYYQELISRMLDGDLSQQEKNNLALHLTDCQECKNLFCAFSAVSGKIKDDLQEPPESMKINVMAAARRASIKGKNRKKIKSILAAAACFVLLGAAVYSLLPRFQAARDSVVYYSDSANDVSANEAAPSSGYEEFSEEVSAAGEGTSDALTPASETKAAKDTELSSFGALDDTMVFTNFATVLAPGNNDSMECYDLCGMKQGEQLSSLIDLDREINLPDQTDPERYVAVTYDSDGGMVTATLYFLGSQVYVEVDGAVFLSGHNANEFESILDN